MSLQEAHDVGCSLQRKLENVEIVERAFVHLDYESKHYKEHSSANKSVKLAFDD